MQPRTTTNKGPEIFDPRGEVSVKPRSPAPRVADLRGLRVAILDNSKWNAGALLRHIGTRLERDYSPAAVTYFCKESFSRVAAPEILAEIAASSDLAVTAIGD